MADKKKNKRSVNIHIFQINPSICEILLFSNNFLHFTNQFNQKEEIAKEFELPERKSKIATIMKHDGEAYCICRSSDCSRFMMYVYK